jgi:protein SCO1/2
MRSCSKRIPRGLVIALIAIVAAGYSACNSNVEEPGSESAGAADCLPNIALTDQNGQSISLASLRGKPVLFDFIYTTCPGPCLVLTARMKAIADQLGPALGAQTQFVSVTVDPEHDNAAALRSYAKEQGVERPGWHFLTGPPDVIDQVMARFKLRRQREADGTVDHVLEFFLVSADGHLAVQYLVSDANPVKIAGDIQELIAGRQLAAR